MRPLAYTALLFGLLGSPALADGIYKDSEVVTERIIVERGVGYCGGRLPRRTNCSPDYVGSEMGLSKPSYYGTRLPDDGLPVRRW